MIVELVLGMVLRAPDPVAPRLAFLDRVETSIRDALREVPSESLRFVARRRSTRATVGVRETKI